MTDNTNTSDTTATVDTTSETSSSTTTASTTATATTTTSTDETVLEKVEDGLESAWTGFKNLAGKAAEGAEEKVELLAEYFADDVWPVAKTQILTLMSKAAQVAISTVVANPSVLAGGFASTAAAIGTAEAATVLPEAIADAKADATTIVLQVQAGLQAAKSVTGTTTGDQATVDAVTAALPSAQ